MGHGRCIKIIIPLWIVVFLVAAFPFSTQADVPMLINYQGYLTDESGTPLSGSRRVNFYLYNVESGGTEFWTEEQTVDLTAGVFNVQLGTVSPLSGDDFLNADIYLEIEIFHFSTEPEWETLTPRQRLTSSAFALRAGDADTFEGHTLAELDAAYVNVGEADTVTSAMVAPNSLTAADLAANSVNASEISTGAVGTLEISNSSVSATDLAEDYVNTSGDTMSGNLELTSNLRLPATTSTTGVIMSDSDTLIHSYGPLNFFAGVSAGNLSMTGGMNTSIGYMSLYSNTTGQRNTGSGSWVLYSNTEGNYNTASGYAALFLNTTGSYNTASGYRVLYSNTEGHDNTASGYNALYSNTTGYFNTASGSYALYNNTDGNRNTASGYMALRYNTAGYSNTATGDSALYSNTTGDNNTANGYWALYSNTEGIYNTASGGGALYSNITGSGNTASGRSALYSNTDGSYNTASGYGALFFNTGGGSNTASGYGALYYNTTGYDNTASGSEALLVNSTGYDNTASGFQALLYNTTGIHDTAIGTRSGYTNETGNGNTFIGCDSDASADDLINATALGYSAVVNGSNRVRIGNTYVSQIGGNVGWSNLSDIRRKEDVEDITLGLDFINALRPVEFSLIDGNSGVDLGFIAQDIETLLGTEYNILGIGGNSDRTLSLRYTDFIAPMVKAIQEQQRQIEEQEAYIKTLEKRLSRLEALLIVSR